MNQKEEKNKAYYQKTMNELQVSDEMKKKLLHIQDHRTGKALGISRKILTVAASLALVLIVSNIAVYAKTGMTWLQQLYGKEMVNDFNNYGTWETEASLLMPIKDSSGTTNYVQYSTSKNGAGDVGGGMLGSFTESDVDPILAAGEGMIAKEIDLSQFTSFSYEACDADPRTGYPQTVLIKIDGTEYRAFANHIRLGDGTMVTLGEVELDEEKYYYRALTSEGGIELSDLQLYTK